MTTPITIKMKIDEDGITLLSPYGKLCRINRDDDSATAAEKVLKNVGFNVEIVDNEGNDENNQM